MNTYPYDLSAQAGKVWAAVSLQDKKNVLLEMIQQMKYKAKTGAFTQFVNTSQDSKKLDKMAADIMLCDIDKVIK